MLTLIGSYQNLAIEARDIWYSWNEAIANSNPADLPAGIEKNDQLLLDCGCYYIADGKEMRAYYADSLESIGKTAPKLRERQFVKVSTRPGSLQCSY